MPGWLYTAYAEPYGARDRAAPPVCPREVRGGALPFCASPEAGARGAGQARPEARALAAAEAVCAERGAAKEEQAAALSAHSPSIGIRRCQFA